MLGWFDYTVLVVYFVGSLAVGLWFGRGERTTKDFFLGGRRQHWLLAGISIVATEVSALTVVGVPAEAFRDNWNYLQMYFGSFVGRLLIVYLLLPAFYGGSVTTVYEYLGQRFGPATRSMATGFFFVARIIGSAVRLLLGSLAISVMFDWSLEWVIAVTALIAIVYTTFGGIKAILWTDVLQAAIFVGAPAALIFYLFWATPGSLSENLTTAYEAGKFQTFTWTWDANNDRSFWVLMVHAVVLNMAALGTDQDLTQRMLTCPDLRRAQKSLIFNAIIGFPIVCLFLLLGSVIYVFSVAGAATPIPHEVLSQTERILPHVIATALPTGTGFKGLLVAAIFAASMSSLASAIGAMSTTAVTDVYRRILPHGSERHYLMAARVASLTAGVVLVIVAIGFAGRDKLLWETFKLVSLVFGGMLGVFLLGVLTRRRGNDWWNCAAMVSSSILLMLLKQYQESRGVVLIAWPWWVVIGTAWTFGWGACFATRKALPSMSAPARSETTVPTLIADTA